MPAIRKLTQNFVATDVDGEVLIVDLDGGELFSLSGTGKAVWEAIDGHRDVAAIAGLLVERYDGEVGAITADVAALVADLEAAALVDCN